MKRSIKIFLLFLLLSLAVFCGSCKKKCKHENINVTVLDPTCTEGGYTTNVCLDCEYTYVSDEKDPKGHNIKATTVPPSCDEQGYTENACFCGYSFISSYVKPTGHDFRDSVISPDCEKPGYTVHICNKCDFQYIDEYTAALGHSFDEETVAPSCTEQGYTVYSCKCGYSYESDYVQTKGHDLVVEITDPTCTEQGFTTYTCKCGYTYVSDFVTTLEHSYNEETTSPTCIEPGYTQYTCECGLSYRSEYVAATGHSLNKTIIAPTCADQGYTSYVCDCGYTYVSDYTSPKGHTYTSTVVNPICSEAGYTVNVCNCGYSVNSNFVSATGHDFEKKITMPTVSDMGYTEFYCIVCKMSYKGNYRFYSEILPNGAYADSTTVKAKGIDVSIWNHPTNATGVPLQFDWNAIKNEGVDYVILKAGSTYSGKEYTFDIDYEGAKAAGVDVGVYFYTYAKTVSQIKSDAKQLLDILDGKQFEYPIYLDLEDESLRDIEPSVLTEMCMAFFTILQENGYYTGLYVNHDWLYNILQTEKMLDLFEIWYARYPQNVSGYVWDVNLYGDHLGMWQYTDKGSLNSIPNISFDLNYAYKDYPAIIKELGFNGY